MDKALTRGVAERRGWDAYVSGAPDTPRGSESTSTSYLSTYLPTAPKATYLYLDLTLVLLQTMIFILDVARCRFKLGGDDRAGVKDQGSPDSVLYRI